MFVQNLIESGYVTLGEKGRTILSDVGKNYLEAQTKNAAVRVELAKLKNLEYRKSLERQAKRNQKKKKEKVEKKL